MNPDSTNPIVASDRPDAVIASPVGAKQSYAQDQKKDTICAVVVTYNRKKLLLECLESLLKQTHPLDAIYLIDNASTDGTPEILLANGYIKTVLTPTNAPLEAQHSINMLSDGNKKREVVVHYVRMHENTGGAGGFYEGVKRGYSHGFEFFWLMDDDCTPEASCLNILMSSANKNTVVGPIVMGDGNQVISLRTVPVEEKKDAKSIAFTGFLVAREIINSVGYPMKDLFIYGDDLEYSYRIRSQGYELLLIKNAVMRHPNIKINVKRTVCFFKKTILYHVEMEPFRLYCYLRNKLLIFFIYHDCSLVGTLFRDCISYLISRKRNLLLGCLNRAILDAIRLYFKIRKCDDYNIHW